MNEKLTQRNEEKTVLLQEVHHRVKNNFQIIISLIKLQTNTVENTKTRDLFDELRMRLIAISRMHEMMYLSDQINKINFKHYVHELIQMILESLSVKHNISVKVTSNVDQITAQSIIPIALILNELITNSIKYAFDEKKDNEKMIEISFHSIKDNYYELKYRDNGIWKTPVEGEGSGFGLELIDILTEQLEGKVERIPDKDGTIFLFLLKI